MLSIVIFKKNNCEYVRYELINQTFEAKDLFRNIPKYQQFMRIINVEMLAYKLNHIL